jgi:hypothetical protein
MQFIERIRNAAYSARRTMLRMGERLVYNALRVYYAALELAGARHDKEPETLPLRTPVHRTVEFYVAHIWPGNLPDALPLVIENPNADAITAAIHQVWTWSNFNAKKQYAVRLFAMTGDLIFKVVSTTDSEAPDSDPTRVYLQVIDPATVSELEEDERGYVQRIRIDVPKISTRRDVPDEPYTYTELWDAQGMRIWNHKQSVDTNVFMLGTAIETKTLEDTGVSFLPFVHAKFRDVGETRGMPACWHALPKIDQCDLMATELHRIIFRFKSVLWALEQTAVDVTGRPLPPPRVTGAEEDGTRQGRTIELGQERFIAVNGTMKCLVPPLQYDDLLHVVQAQEAEIAKDLPELRFYEIQASTQIATETLRLLLAPALTRILEARGNAEAALIRANQIALTMAQKLGLAGFEPETIGTYEKGDFEHSIKPRDVWPMTEGEQADLLLKRAQASQAKKELGWSLETILREDWGFTDDEVLAFMKLKSAEDANSQSFADVLMNASMRRFNAGGAAA